MGSSFIFDLRVLERKLYNMKRFILRWGDTMLLIVFVALLFANIVMSAVTMQHLNDLELQLDEIHAELQDTVKQVDALELEVAQMRNRLDSIEGHLELTEAVLDSPEGQLWYTVKDAETIAKMLWGEARGVPDLYVGDKRVSAKCQQAAVVWTVLNRYDAGYENSIAEVVRARGQYHGYSPDNPVDENLLALTIEVLNQWSYEKETGFGFRVLPSDYLWFSGDGTYNHFRNGYERATADVWAWEIEDPYAE